MARRMDPAAAGVVGEKTPVAKNPITHKGFFEREI